MTNRKTDGWSALLFSVALPAALGIALAAVVVLLSGCEKRAPDPSRWSGMDRSKVSCADDDEAYPHRQKTCVGDGLVHKCVSEDGSTWRCADLAAPREPSDQAGSIRFKVGCTYDSVDPPRRQVSCVVAGRAYKCVAEDGRAWHCAEVEAQRPPTEAPGGGGRS